jgi:acyl-CoA synthetase (NDP forming)
MKRDPQFGPVLLFGLGGVLVALLKDTAVRLIPVGHEEALETMAETKLHLLLEGYRQFAPADKQALASILLKVSALAQ